MRKATGRIRPTSIINQAGALHEAAPTLPVVVLGDAPMACPRCGRPAWFDRETIMATNAHRALWICQGGHDGWVTLTVPAAVPA